MKLTQSQWSLKLLASDMDPMRAAIKMALDMSDGYEDESDMFHAVFFFLCQLNEAMGWDPPSPDDTVRDLRAWLVERRAA